MEAKMIASLNVRSVGRWRKTKIFLVFSLAISISSGFIPMKSAFADTISDSGFESGDFTGWNKGNQTGTQTGGVILYAGSGVKIVSGNQTFAASAYSAYGQPTFNGAPNPYYQPAVAATTWTFGPYGTYMGSLQPQDNSPTFDAATAALELTSPQNLAIKTTLTDQRGSFNTANAPYSSAGANPTNAAWITRSVTLTAGTVYTMVWNYIGTDYVPFNDGSITSLVFKGNGATPTITINNSVGNYALLGFTNPGTGDYSTGHFGSTGWQQSEYEVSVTGEYLLGFAVFNLSDTALSPVLLVDSDPGTTKKGGVLFAGVTPNNPDAPPPPPIPTVTPVKFPSSLVMFAQNGADTSSLPQSEVLNDTKALWKNPMSRAGYTFNGWNTKADGTGTAYADGAIFKFDSPTIILYAQWKLIQTKPTITWATPTPIQEGTALSATQLNAVGSVPGTYTYSPAAAAVPAVGKQILKVTFVPTDPKYETIDATVEIEVLAKAKITWANPASIIEGTALSSTQLNATASVPGSFVYDPKDGALLAPGKSTLKVTFTPTDSRLTAVTAEVSIDVTAKPVVIPAPPISPTYSVTRAPKTTITWGAGKDAATYTVLVDGKSACSVAALTCDVAQLLGPNNVVTVTSVALSTKTSAAITASYVAPASSQVLTVVNFDTAKAIIKTAEAAKLRAFAALVKAAGYTTLTVYGHTDSVGGIDNQKLSVARANAAITYLKKLLPGVTFEVSGFAASKPVADNATAEGKASNRRTEIFIP